MEKVQQVGLSCDDASSAHGVEDWGEALFILQVDELRWVMLEEESLQAVQVVESRGVVE